MNPYLIFYITNAVLSSLLSFFTFYLILQKSRYEMRRFRWILLNIQISAYVQTMFWCLFLAPSMDTSPIVYLTPLGIGTWLRIPGNIPIAIGIVLHGCIDGSMALALFLRYWMLLPLVGIRIHWVFFIIPPIMQYVIGGGGCGLCSLFSFLTEQETKDIILQKSPNATSLPGSLTFGGPGTLPWACILIFAISAGTFCICFIIIHSNIILKKSSSSKRTKSLHKSAMTSLVLQLTASFSCSLLPMALFSYQLLLGADEVGHWVNLGFLVPLCLPYFSMKAINCSLTCILTTKPYRIFILDLFGLRRQESKAQNSFMVSQNQRSMVRQTSIRSNHIYPTSQKI